MARKKYQKKEPVTRVPFKLSHAASDDQLAIKDCWLNDLDNIFIPAVAGSGKSSTLAFLMACAANVVGAYIAFNKDIVTEMEPKCPPGVTVKTRHAFGYVAFAKKGIRLKVEKDKLSHALEKNGYVVSKEDELSYERCQSIKRLIDQMKNNLIDVHDHEGIDRMCYFYDIDIDCLDEVKVKLPKIFELIVSLGMEGIIDFVDMKWLPVHLKWEMNRFPVLFLDEYQDSSSLDMAFDKMLLAPGGRVVIVGDARQSIYGFAGANCDSIEIASQQFLSSEFALNKTFRCSPEVVAHAQRIVPHIEAWEGTKPGRVVRMFEEFEPTSMDPNAMVLCRRNAPLVRPCFKALKAGVKANIKGRDIGAGLITIINKQNAETIPTMLDKMEDFFHRAKERVMSRKRVNPMTLELLEDQQSIIEAFAMEPDIQTISQLKSKIKEMFTEDKTGMVFSSVHRSKGLEADHVVILDAKRIRLSFDKMTDEARTQEANLEYVAITRAKGNLYLDLAERK